MNWNDERVELLRKLWQDGLSASQIAAQLGGVSRNAVIGKVHRLKLSARGRATAAAARPKKAPKPIGAGMARPASRPTPSRPMTATVGAADLSCAPGAGERRRADLAAAEAGRADRAHLQMAERRPAGGGFQLLRQ